MEKYAPDVIIYDVLGDVVCGGFAMPIRNGFAKDVFIVTSGEMMSLYAANNIAEAVKSFAADGYARLGGLIQNSRAVESENEIIDKAASEIGTKVIARIPRDPAVQRCEALGKTVVEGEPDSEQAKKYRELADTLFNLSEDISGGMRCE
jgi:nitrogenase iron protein NifH